MSKPVHPLIKASDVPAIEHTPGGSVRFWHGDEQGLGAMTVAMSYNPPGGGAPEHRHSCAEVFVVYEGRGVYTIDGAGVAAEAGDIVVIPPNTWHSFRADSDVPLRHVAAFDCEHVDFEMRS